MHPDQNRERYESERDRAKERAVVDFLMQAMGWKHANRTPRYYPCDWVIQLDDRSFALLEVKCRDRQYENYMISLHKAATLLLYAELGGYIPMLGVQWSDKKTIGLWNPFRRDYLTPGIGGRRDRGDAQDVEPVVWVPTRYCQLWDYL